MADHVRKQIRAAAVLALTGLTTTASRVYDSRVFNLQASELPALRIYAQDEQIQIASMGAARLRQRELELVVEAVIQASSGYANTLDEIQRQVEVAIDANQDLGGLAKYVELVRVQDTFEDELEKVTALKRMVFEVLYFTAQGAPDSAI